MRKFYSSSAHTWLVSEVESTQTLRGILSFSHVRIATLGVSGNRTDLLRKSMYS